MVLFRSQVKKSTLTKTQELLVFVFNAVEDEWTYISGISSARERRRYIEDSEADTDCYFLATATEQSYCYISPMPVDAGFIAYANTLFKSRDSHIVVPKTVTHLLCEDFMYDQKSFKSFVQLAKHYKRVRLVSYVVSEQFYALKERLEVEGLTVKTPEAPERKNAWTINFFGSKSGIRQLSQMSSSAEPDFKMPEGLICSGRYDAAKIAALRYIRNNGVVLKTNKGCAGNGVHIFRKGDLPLQFTECEHKILGSLSKDAYWDTAPIVVEDLIETRSGQYESYPNIEFTIDANGCPKMLYLCNCIVTPAGAFYGVDIGYNVLSSRVRAKVEDMGYYIADQYSKAGYRGRFDIDMMVARNNRLYVNESNTRYTGGSDTYKIVRKLLGVDFAASYYVLARSRKNWVRADGLTFSKLQSYLAPILYSPKKKEGLIVQSWHACTEGFITYTIIASSRKRAYGLERQLKEILIGAFPAHIGNYLL
jgi:hypothetical protein